MVKRIRAPIPNTLSPSALRTSRAPSAALSPPSRHPAAATKTDPFDAAHRYPFYRLF